MKATVSLFILAIVSIPTSAADKSEQLSDEMIRSLIPGSWVSREVLNGQPVTLSVEYRFNGTLGASVQATEGRYTTKSTLRGTWQVRNKFLISHTESTGSPTRVTAYEVLAIDETTLILRDRDGGVIVRRRPNPRVSRLQSVQPGRHRYNP